MLTDMDGQQLQRQVAIVGFADSWVRTPWENPHLDLWGLNSLHKIAQDKPWSAWFQLHDLDTHHGKDDEHLGWLASREIPIYMFPEHAVKYRDRIPMVTDYPKEEILKFFDTDYFTNSISWMIALAIYQDYNHIGVYGVDMAQTTEYREQRPSCEFFLGWAKGAGIDIVIPDDSDLLKTSHLYGLEESRGHIKRLKARMQKVQEQRAQVESQINQGQSVLNQLIGQQENMNYVLQTWTSNPEGEGEGEEGT
jgi:hypothetical protein